MKKNNNWMTEQMANGHGMSTMWLAHAVAPISIDIHAYVHPWAIF